MTRKLPFVGRTLLGLGATAACGLFAMSCGGSGGSGGVISGVVGAFAGSAIRADLSGQENAFSGTLGSGVTLTFPVVKGANYVVQFEATKSDAEVVIDVIGDDGSALRSKSLKSGEGFAYLHEPKSQHVLVVCRPRNPFDTSIGVTRLTVTGMGNFARDRVHVNFCVAGSFTGWGQFGDLKDQPSQAAFTDAVMTRVRTLFQQTGISITYEGFAYTADQVKALQPGLIGPDDQALCAAGESVSSAGFERVETSDLDRWGALGFDVNDPNFNRGHGVDVFFLHHFTKDGTVGLSPRPGMIVGKGPETALAAGAFVQFNGSLVPRTVDQIALVVAHELGHFLGLQHTTTFDPSPQAPTRAIDDGLADTPKCDVLTDTNGDGFVGLGDGCPDEGNVMFYQSGTQAQFSPRQAEVMKTLLSLQEH